jgi:hypothetical protein
MLSKPRRSQTEARVTIRQGRGCITRPTFMPLMYEIPTAISSRPYAVDLRRLSRIRSVSRRSPANRSHPLFNPYFPHCGHSPRPLTIGVNIDIAPHGLEQLLGLD